LFKFTKESGDGEDFGVG